MPTDQKFEEFEKENFEKVLSIQEIRAAMQQKSTEQTDQDAWYEWCLRTAFSHLRVARPPIPVPELLLLITKTNFNNSSDVKLLKEAINSGSERGKLSFGRCFDDHYRTALRTKGLINKAKPIPDRLILPSEYVGVNREAPVELTHQQFVSDESDESSSPGFVSYQLGQVEQFEGEDLDAEDFGHWQYTGFCAVIQFSTTGDATGIYLLYDFYQIDECSGFNLQLKNEHFPKCRGYLDGYEKPFWCAKIVDGKDIGSLSQGFVFALEDIDYHRVQLTRVVQTSLGTIIRAEVPSSKDSKPSPGAFEEMDQSPSVISKR